MCPKNCNCIGISLHVVKTIRIVAEIDAVNPMHCLGTRVYFVYSQMSTTIVDVRVCYHCDVIFSVASGSVGKTKAQRSKIIILRNKSRVSQPSSNTFHPNPILRAPACKID